MGRRAGSGSVVAAWCGNTTGQAVTWTINPCNNPAYAGGRQNWDSAQGQQQFGAGDTGGCLGEAGLSPGSHTAEVRRPSCRIR